MLLMNKTLSNDLVVALTRNYGRRLQVLENQIKRLRKNFRTVYQFHYARSKRRAKLESLHVEKVVRWINLIEGHDGRMKQLSIIAAQLVKGRKIYTLSSKEYWKLKYILNNKKKD